MRHPQIPDLGLIAVAPGYVNCGVAMVAMVGLFHFLQEENAAYKRRRSFVKKPVWQSTAK